jgi:uncharacterized protein (TIGR03437 family)
LALYDVTTYSFPGNGAPAVFPAFLDITQGSGTVLAYGPGLSDRIPAVSAGVLGGGVLMRSVSPYGPDPRFAEIRLDFTPFTGTGPRHLVFSLDGDVYVRPAGVQLVARVAPLVRAVQAETGADGRVVLVLSGDSLSADSQVYVDGLSAPSAGFDEAAAQLRVMAPPGTDSRKAVITVYNPEGQSSVFVQPSEPLTYEYPPSPGPASLSVSPASAPAGRDVMIQIDGVNTNFTEGQTVVGFGTSDVVTRQVWVVSTTRLLAVVSISSRAAQVSSTVSVTAGLQVVTLPSGFKVEPPAPASNVPVIGYQGLVSTATSLPRVAPGSLARLLGVNLTLGGAATATAPLPTSLAGATVTINDQPIPLLRASPAQIELQLPFTLSPGPAILRVSNGAQTSAPMVVQIDAVAPGLIQVVTAAGAPVSVSSPARPGDVLLLFGTGLGAVVPPVAAGAAAPLASVTSTVRVRLNGTELTPFFAGLAPGTVGVYQINVQLPANLAPAASLELFVTVNGQPSNALAIGIR